MRGLTQISRRGSDAPPAPLAFAGPLDVGLVLTHACNLACSYCYTGEKKRVRMPATLGHRAIEQAIVRQVHHRHATGADPLDEPVLVELVGGLPLAHRGASWRAAVRSSTPARPHFQRRRSIGGRPWRRGRVGSTMSWPSWNCSPVNSFT